MVITRAFSVRLIGTLQLDLNELYEKVILKLLQKMIVVDDSMHEVIFS